MKSLFILILSVAFLVVTTHAQNSMSWKQHVKLADKSFKAKSYTDAAEHYHSAWKKKTAKNELLEKAALCYFKVRQYKKAAGIYKNIKDGLKDPLAGLNYGRSLKQAGEYDIAIKEYLYFLNAYQGDDKNIVSAIVQNEIRGCEYALKLAEEEKESSQVLSHLNENVNTHEAEFALIPFSEDIVYFSSTMEGKSSIYRSQLVGGAWTKAIKPESFPSIANAHFCNGSFSPDTRRFYFTLCKNIVGHGGEDDNCSIYVTHRSDNGWSAPEKLREYINMPKTSNAHPFVFYKDDMEHLLFSSNRKGGKGGMDIWHMSRRLDSDEMDFTLPQNAGSINTMGDEITPYYDSEQQKIFFSSNGQVSLGGFDIFSAQENDMNFSAVKNIGLPWNSAADDYFFTKTKSGNQSFLSSNRMFGHQKITTTDDDIFMVTSSGIVNENMVIAGKILASDQTELHEVSTELYERNASGRERLLQSEISEDGTFSFSLLPEKEYLLQLYKVGYMELSYPFKTNRERNSINRDFTLDKISASNNKIASVASVYTEPKLDQTKIMAVTAPEPSQPSHSTATASSYTSPEIVKTEPYKPRNTYQSTTTYTPSPTVSVTNSDVKRVESIFHEPEIRYKPRGEDYEITSSAPIRSGKTYKVQIIAVKSFNANHKRYNRVRHLGRLDTERIIERGLVRVLLADYYSRDEALKVMEEVSQYSAFEKAFIVKYVDGRRVGISY